LQSTLSQLEAGKWAYKLILAAQKFAIPADQVWIFPNCRAGIFKEYKIFLFTQDKISAVRKANAEMFFKLTCKFFDGFESGQSSR
jgi:hypothetical protein